MFIVLFSKAAWAIHFLSLHIKCPAYILVYASLLCNVCFANIIWFVHILLFIYRGCVCTCTFRNACGSQQMALDPLELGLQEFVNNPKWRQAGSAFNHTATSLVQ